MSRIRNWLLFRRAELRLSDMGNSRYYSSARSSKRLGGITWRAFGYLQDENIGSKLRLMARHWWGTWNFFMIYNGIRHTTSAPYQPRTNGFLETFVETLKQALHASRSSNSPVLTRLLKSLLAYRNTPQAINESPAKLFKGYELNT